MRYEKDYVVTYRDGKDGIPCTVMVSAYNKDEAKQKCRKFFQDNVSRWAKPEFKPDEKKIAERAANLTFHFGIVGGSILDIRADY